MGLHWKQSVAATPRSSFSYNSTAEEVRAGLNLAGMTAVVTGCNSGIGYETMRVLALRGAHVIGTRALSRRAGKPARASREKRRRSCWSSRTPDR